MNPWITRRSGDVLRRFLLPALASVPSDSPASYSRTTRKPTSVHVRIPPDAFGRLRVGEQPIVLARVVARRAAQVGSVRAIRASAHHVLLAGIGTARINGDRVRQVRVSSGVVPIQAEFPHVAQHVHQPPGIGFGDARGVSFIRAVTLIPGVIDERRGLHSQQVVQPTLGGEGRRVAGERNTAKWFRRGRRIPTPPRWEAGISCR